jgi:hypothetical protein
MLDIPADPPFPPPGTPLDLPPVPAPPLAVLLLSPEPALAPPWPDDTVELPPAALSLAEPLLAPPLPEEVVEAPPAAPPLPRLAEDLVLELCGEPAVELCEPEGLSEALEQATAEQIHRPHAKEAIRRKIGISMKCPEPSKSGQGAPASGTLPRKLQAGSRF